MFMICNLVMSCSTDNPYCVVRNHICMCDSLCVRRASCEAQLAHLGSRHGRGTSPRRGLRPLGSGGKCLVRGVRVARRRGGEGARAERASARLSPSSPVSPHSRLAGCDVRNDANRARAVPARALRSELSVRQARLRRACRPAPRGFPLGAPAPSAPVRPLALKPSPSASSTHPEAHEARPLRSSLGP